MTARRPSGKRLTRRQRQCLEGRLAHLTAKEIARLLGISHYTVAMHWRHARLRLGARDTLEAAKRSKRLQEASGNANEGPEFGTADIWLARMAAAAILLGAFSIVLAGLGLLTFFAASWMGWPLHGPSTDA